MKTKFTYHRSGGAAVDLVATLDSKTTIGDLAEHLRNADPDTTPGAIATRVTLTLIDRQNTLLDPDLLVADSALHSGADVSLAQAGSAYGARLAAPAARLRILTGADAGKVFSVPFGAATIGRDASCDVVLADRLASRRHARLNITDVAEVIDLGSANGVTVGGATVPRATLRPGDVVGIGDTELAVELLRTTPGAVDATAFNRSPRVSPLHEGREFETPGLPEPARPQRFPLVALLAPLVMGGVLFLVTKSIASIAFVALSPVMLVGNAVEARLGARREFRRAVEEYDEQLAELGQLLREETTQEARARRVEHPSASVCLSAVLDRTSLLWARRPDLPGFGELALGTATLPSRSTIAYPHAGRGPVALLERAHAALDPLAVAADVPLVVRLADGALGVAGPRSVSLGLVRALVVQAAALHSPAELVIAAMLSAESTREWDWLKWLPHTSSVHSPVAGPQLTSRSGDVVALLLEMEKLVDARRGDGSERLPAVLVLVEAGAAVERARLTAVAESGAEHGVHVLWMAPDETLLPAACRTFAVLDPAGGPGRAGFVTTATEVVPVAFDEVSGPDAAAAARRLSPLYDAGAVVADESDLPRSVSQFALLGSDIGSDVGALIERWQQNSSILTGPYAPGTLPRKAGNLRAVVGQSPLGQHALDLRADGPHALVGGTTGAGKSELLQSWILSLAAAHSPQRVTFLLVDYKGGSAFSECVDLPHCIGLVTDLSPHLVRRALTSLRAEVRYREELLARHAAKDLATLEAQGSPDAPPSLVIVVDEFAALATEVPEFVDGMVDVAQRGRSLGLHLILATQRPAGVIKDNLRANTNLRLALRMADEADSTDILGTPVAASFDPSVPGRAMSRSGPSRLVPFQGAYAGGWTTDAADERPDVVVEALTLGAAQRWTPRTSGEPVLRDREQTDIKRLVRVAREASRGAGLPPPRKAWMPVLSARQSLLAIHRRALDTELTFGVVDDPEGQHQPTTAFEPDRHGNMVVYGTGGTGKSTFLRSIAIAAGITMKGGPCFVYGLDFGARGLAMLEELPHVGSIVSGGDHERVTRLLGWLRAQIDERAARYSRVSADTVTSYRTLAGQPEEPRILLLLDGIAAFRAAYESTDRVRWIDTLVSIASEGRTVGVHVVLSSETRAGMTTGLASAVQRRLVLRMAIEDDYPMLGAPSDVLDQHAPPGRGLLDDLEVQVAVLGGVPDLADQAREVSRLAASMRAAGVAAAPPIRSLPSLVLREQIPSEGLVLGVRSDDLRPLLIQPQGAFLLAGPTQSGRTTTLEYLARSVAQTQPERRLFYFGHRRSQLAGLDVWKGRAFGPDDIATAALELAALLGEEDHPDVAVFLENGGDYASGPVDAALAVLVKACLLEEQWFVVEGESSTLAAGGYNGFLPAVKVARRGLVLQPDQENGSALFKTPFGRLARSDFPPGRGIYVSGGKPQVVQVATLPTADGAAG